MFSFKLVHVPGKEFQDPDGHSRLQRTKENEEEYETAQEADQWVEDIYMCGLRIVDHHQKRWRQQNCWARHGGQTQEAMMIVWLTIGLYSS